MRAVMGCGKKRMRRPNPVILKIFYFFFPNQDFENKEIIVKQ